MYVKPADNKTFNYEHEEDSGWREALYYNGKRETGNQGSLLTYCAQ
jgi:hypothetical protein